MILNYDTNQFVLKERYSSTILIHYNILNKTTYFIAMER